MADPLMSPEEYERCVRPLTDDERQEILAERRGFMPGEHSLESVYKWKGELAYIQVWGWTKEDVLKRLEWTLGRAEEDDDLNLQAALEARKRRSLS